MHDFMKHRQILGWAAYCHEIGCAISHSESQRHGAYILDNTELMGFAQSELHRLSLLVLGHYGKLRKLEADFNDEVFICQLLALRLAVIFCHSRNMPVLKTCNSHVMATAFCWACQAHGRRRSHKPVICWKRKCFHGKNQLAVSGKFKRLGFSE